MKSKAFTYLLLVVVAIVWYNVFFRIKSNFMSEDTVIPTVSTSFSMIQSKARDTFDLNANYRDPFESVSENKIATPIVPVVPIIQAPPVYKAPKVKKVHQWPQVKYFGLLKKSTSKKAICIVEVDGSLFNLTEGEYLYDDYMVKSIYRDSLVIKYNKLKKTFVK